MAVRHLERELVGALVIRRGGDVRARELLALQDVRRRRLADDRVGVVDRRPGPGRSSANVRDAELVGAQLRALADRLLRDEDLASRPPTRVDEPSSSPPPMFDTATNTSTPVISASASAADQEPPVRALRV